MERYESLGLVGEGSYGTVLKCRHRDTSRLVAIKKFVDSDSDKTVKKIALREIKLLRKLHHDNLVNLLEVWKRRRRWYLVFEFVERTLLEDLEQNPNGLDMNTTQQYLYQILRAAAFCHEQNIIHRDIKPENILISQEGVVKLCDFGFARTLASPAEADVYTDYVATRWYRAPELLVGDIKYGKPVDVWAVGCLFSEMLTGQPLFPGDSDLDQIYHIIRCFGNLTAHHQELFYRNPVFSGVSLPECSVQVPLQDRCPTITLTALDLAKSCLQMDPEGRAQCSHLLEHPLFMLDCFHIRFMDELNAKIQRDHRENSTLPKITKTPRQDKDGGNNKIQKGKNKKQLGDRKDEEKMEKTKGQQPLKLSKSICNSTETSMTTKQSKTVGAKVTDNTTRAPVDIKCRTGKATGTELIKEHDIFNTICADPSESTWTGTGLNGNNTVAAKPKHGKVASKEPKKDYLKMTNNTEDTDSTNLCSSYSDTAVPSETSDMEPSQGFWKSWSNLNTNVPQSSPLGRPNVSSASRASSETAGEQTGVSLPPKACQQSSIHHSGVTTIEPPSIIALPKALKVLDNEDSVLSLVNQTSRIFESWSNGKTETDEYRSKSFISQPHENLGSFSKHTKPLKSPKATFHKEARKMSGDPERTETTNVFSMADLTSAPSTRTPDQRALTRSFVFCNMDTAAFNECAQHSYPPPPPSSTPVLLPLPSTPLMPPSSVVSTNSPPVSNHHNLRSGFHPVNHRCVDKPRHRGGVHSRPAQHITASITAQVSDKNFGNSSGVPATKKKSEIHFPDLRSSVLPELRGREGKHNKGITKNQRKDKQPVPHICPSEPQQYRHDSTDTPHTPKHSS